MKSLRQVVEEHEVHELLEFIEQYEQSEMTGVLPIGSLRSAVEKYCEERMLKFSLLQVNVYIFEIYRLFTFAFVEHLKDSYFYGLEENEAYSPSPYCVL